MYAAEIIHFKMGPSDTAEGKSSLSLHVSLVPTPLPHLFSLREILALVSLFVLIMGGEQRNRLCPEKQEKHVSVSTHVCWSFTLSCLRHSSFSTYLCFEALIKFRSWAPVQHRNDRGEYFRIERGSSPLHREHVISLSLYDGRVGDSTMAGKV